MYCTEKIHVLYMFRGQSGDINAGSILRVHTPNRESNGTNGDDMTICWWSFTNLALLPADEPLELFVAVEERVELGGCRGGVVRCCWGGRVSREGCQRCRLYVGEIGRMDRRRCVGVVMGI
jgi:hypothetical protein